MPPHHDSILVVDEASDTAEVLKAVLGPRGMTVNHVRHPDRIGPPHAGPRPLLVVLDAESLPDDRVPPSAEWRSTPQVIIGTLRSVANECADRGAGGVQRRFLSKPFQFAELVSAIEAIVGIAETRKRNAQHRD